MFRFAQHDSAICEISRVMWLEHGDKVRCLIGFADSTSRHARGSSATAAAKISAVVWAAPQHHHQIARGRRARVGVADSPWQ